MAKLGGGPKTQDYMPEDDFDPSEPIPMPEEPVTFSTSEGPGDPMAAPEPDGKTPRHMQMYNQQEDGPAQFDAPSLAAEAPPTPSMPMSSQSPYATPGSAGSRPYQSPNLDAGTSFAASQGFGAGGGEGLGEDDDLIAQIVAGLGKRG